ncbi:MAG: iron-sulfur cluster assembly accessory protein [Elusimicrobia bacterium]|nr:iron-sulfur cluster assembly accessory protein [Elusimicrobiota bacterium]
MSETTTTIPLLTLSDKATKKIQEFFATEADAKGKSLRVSLEPGGCSGYQYSFGFDVKKEGDNEIACDGFSVLVDANSSQYLKGSAIDFAEDAGGAGFKIHNPNVKKSCGCGQSNSF